jgi:hypothetical protein
MVYALSLFASSCVDLWLASWKYHGVSSTFSRKLKLTWAIAVNGWKKTLDGVRTYRCMYHSSIYWMLVFVFSCRSVNLGFLLSKCFWWDGRSVYCSVWTVYISNEDAVYFYLGDSTARRKLIGIVSAAVCAHCAPSLPGGLLHGQTPPPPKLPYLSPS